MPDESSPSAGRGKSPDESVGLCSICQHARSLESAKGSTFWRCGLAARNPSYLPYPPLPVLACDGFSESPNDED